MRDASPQKICLIDWLGVDSPRCLGTNKAIFDKKNP
jgi:hypothetical protein